MTARYKKRLSYRQALISVTAAFVIGAILSLTQVIYDLANEKERLEKHILQVMSTLKQPAAQALYTVDRRLAQMVIDGLFEYQTVYYASLMDEFGEVYAEHRRELPGGRFRELFLTLSGSQTEFTIPLTFQPQQRNVGHIQVYLDSYAEMITFIDRAIVVFVSGMVRNILLALVLIVVFNITLVRPLLRLISDISEREPGKAHTPLFAPKGHQESELGQLAAGTNRLLDRFVQALEAQREAEKALRLHQEGLEQIIAERTRELAHMASHDGLTTLPNRSLFSAQLNIALAHAQRNHGRMAIFFMDLDGFKQVNDCYGHEMGDRILIEAASRLQNTVRREDLVARIGGDEFILLISDLKQCQHAFDLADKLIEVIRQPIQCGREHHIGLSIGIAFYPDDGNTPDQLISCADSRMYAAKKAGKGRYVAQTEEVAQGRTMSEPVV
jgi:diguanylate cyclase (GGDEF)-like protein